MRFFFSTLFLLLFSASIWAQPAPGCPNIDVGADIIFNCDDSCTTLNASYLATGATDAYRVNSIPYAPPYPFTSGTPVSVGTDDVWSPVIPLPFNFCFFGNVYNQVVVGSNGVITFDVSRAGGGCGWSFNASLPDPALFTNTIFGIYHDIDPSVCGSVRQGVFGSAPCRTFVFNFNDVCHFSCTSLRSTTQVVLYESTNVVEVYVEDKPTCTTWNSGNAVIGIQNQTATVGYTPPGRNTGPWTVSTPEAWRFTPDGLPNFDIEWFESGVSIGTGPSVNVCPAGNTSYEASITYTNCDGATIIERDSLDLTFSTLFEIDASLVDSASCGLADGSAQASITIPSTGPYSYLWDDPAAQTTSIATGLAAGSYCVTATDANGCTDSACVVVPSGSFLLDTIVGQDPSCLQNDGFAYVGVSGGSPPYSFLWDDPAAQTTDTAFGLAPGTYSVTVQDNAGCVGTDSVTLLPGDTVTAQLFSDSTSCFSGLDGSAWAVPSGGSAPYSYQWNGNPALNNDTLLGASAGFQVVEVTDSNGCVFIDSVEVLEPLEIILSTDSTPASCSGGLDGTATVTAAGGTGPYSYLWDDPAAQTTDTATALAAGTYQVVVTDFNGCEDSVAIDVTEPSLLVVDSIQAEQVTCYGLSDGSATVWPSGGTGPYTYLWDDPSAQITQTATGLLDSLVGVTVTDANGCTVIDSVVVPSPTLVIDTVGSISPLCAEDSGLAFVSVSNGLPPYTFLWNDALSQTTDTATGLAPGSYTITVQDSLGCTLVDSVVVLPGDTVTAQLFSDSTSCFSSLDGSAWAIPSGGITPYTYQWNSNPALSNDTLPGASAGFQVVEVTDSNGCVFIDSIEVLEPLEIILSADSIPVSCFGGVDGSATVTVAGGTGPYSYLWNDPAAQTTDTATGLAAGTYQVVVTDFNGCVDSVSIDVTEPAELQIDSLDSTAVSCFGFSDGTTTVTVSGGTTPYSYLWNDPAAQTTPTATGLQTGVYSVIVTDNNGCVVADSLFVPEPTPLVILTADTSNAQCFGASDGQASITASGGTTPYSYLWDDPAGQTNDTAVGLAAGNYVATVTDNNGCSADTSLAIAEPLAIDPTVLSVTDATCFGAMDGEVSLAATNGFPPFTYEVDGVVQPGDSVFTGLSAGSYWGHVTDVGGCVDSVSFVIDQPDAVSLSTINNSVDCNGNNTGFIVPSAVGGTPPYLFALDGSSFASVDTFSNLVAGTYTVFAQDIAGCLDSADVIITEPEVLLLSASADSVSCNGLSDGEIQLLVGGGSLNYDLFLTQGGDTVFLELANTTGIQSVDNLSSGNYTASVVDENGCRAEQILAVGEPLPDAFTISQIDSVSCFGQQYNDGAIFIDALPNPPYSFSIEGQDNFGPSPVSNLSAGVYSIVAVNRRGCFDTIPDVVVPQPNPIILEASPVDSTIELGESLELLLSGQNVNLGNATISWFPTTGLDCSACVNPTASPYQTTTYQISVTDIDGCFSETTLTLFVEDEGPVFIPNAFTPNDDGTNDRFRVYGNDIKAADLEVYNRWGELIWKGDGVHEGWNGEYQGAIQSPGVYTFYVNIVFLNDASVQKKGSVTLIR